MSRLKQIRYYWAWHSIVIDVHWWLLQSLLNGVKPLKSINIFALNKTRFLKTSLNQPNSKYESRKMTKIRSSDISNANKHSPFWQVWASNSSWVNQCFNEACEQTFASLLFEARRTSAHLHVSGLSVTYNKKMYLSESESTPAKGQCTGSL